MNKLIITGGLTKDAIFRTTSNGKSVLSFDVANDQGFGDNKHTEYYQCSVWNKQAEGLNGKLLKGCKVVVMGEQRVEKREHDGKEYHNNKINFADVEVMKWADNQPQSSQPSQQPQQQPSNGFDDDIPF
jgi:single-strand DNA-binding protein